MSCRTIPSRKEYQSNSIYYNQSFQNICGRKPQTRFCSNSKYNLQSLKLNKSDGHMFQNSNLRIYYPNNRYLYSKGERINMEMDANIYLQAGSRRDNEENLVRLLLKMLLSFI